MAFSDMADDAIPRGRLRGKVAVITGASYGIGRGLAMRFAREGARLVLCSRTASRAGEMLDELRAITPAVHYVPADVGIRSEIEHVIAEAARVYGRVDALVNNAQTVMPWTPLEDKPDDDWQQTLQSGLQATLWAMRAAFPLMKAQGGGRIVNFGSIFGVNGSRWAADYAACKEAIRGLTRTAANEWGRYGITVNVVLPAAESDATKAFKQNHPAAYQLMRGRVPLHRHGDPETDIGGAILGLVADEGRFITGETFFLDGGLGISRPVQAHQPHVRH
jgi:NAD(P)-dependent dehydrogenase (short-subunit alcohol dehydrogenase family)